MARQSLLRVYLRVGSGWLKIEFKFNQVRLMTEYDLYWQRGAPEGFQKLNPFSYHLLSYEL